MHKQRRYLILGLVVTAMVLLPFQASAQKPNKFEDAIARSKDAGRIITWLAVMPDSEIPKELIDNAKAIGVFPKVKQETLYFSKMSQGYGVISSRLGAGWSMPAYYKFSGGGLGNPFSKDDAHGVIFLFMSADALSWFEKGGVPLTNEKKAIAGPIGSITDEQRKEMEGAQVLAYAYYNGKLDGKSFGTSFWKKFSLDPDNNINNPLYGMKGREVLAGKNIETTATIPSGISTFQQSLQKYYPSAIAFRSKGQ
jgi:lipid-binding SYLF domain-containing protein